MRIVVIGATGHVGGYLVPRLVEAGHEVIALSRGQHKVYREHGAWETVRRLVVDRSAEETAGTFGRRVRDLQPDAVVDMICFTLSSAQHLVEGLRGHVQHFLSCGTIWVHGHSVQVPTTEDQVRCPFGEYGVQKAQIEAYLLKEARLHGFPATVLHPGHIVGTGWAPLNPAGHFNPGVFVRLARGESLSLPNLGLETVHHVHADDVALAFAQALVRRNSAVGESFHVVSPAALTLRGYAEAVAGWFGKTASLSYLPWEQWRAATGEDEAAQTWDHIAHSPNCCIEKARRLLGFRPRYSSLEAVYESVMWLFRHNVSEVA